MKNALLVTVILATFICQNSVVQAQHPRVGGLYTLGNNWARGFAASRPWHGQHYYLPYGQPTAVVVPPNSGMQQHYSWGVSQNLMTPIYHQYGRGGMPSSGGAFYGTPVWPSHTDQSGVYSVRAPW